MKVFGKWVLSDRYNIAIEEHWEDNFDVGSIKVSTLPMEHGEACIGYRFDDSQGKSLVYSGDTAPCSNIIKLATGCDALLMECTQPESSPKEGHTSTLQAGAIAKKADVKTLFLTHISPENDTIDLDSQVSAVYDGVVFAVRDGMRVTI